MIFSRPPSKDMVQQSTSKFTRCRLPIGEQTQRETAYSLHTTHLLEEGRCPYCGSEKLYVEEYQEGLDALAVLLSKAYMTTSEVTGETYLNAEVENIIVQHHPVLMGDPDHPRDEYYGFVLDRVTEMLVDAFRSMADQFVQAYNTTHLRKKEEKE